MERKVGEIFEYNGEWYQCIPDTTDANCNNCFFQKSCSDITGDCSSTARSDGKSVAFKKLEKVGEPYHDSEKKLCQQYKCYINPLVTDEIVYVFADNKAVIEIKQNKEDMEEKKQKLGKLVDDYMTCRIQYAEFEKGIRELYEKHSNSEKIGKNLKPFDLQKAIEGKPVCTRDGRKARIICFDAKRKDEKSIIALVPSNDYHGFEDLIAYPNNGNYHGGHENDGDLMMLPEKKEGWANVYDDTPIYDTKEEALNRRSEIRGYIDTVKVSWEE